MVSKNTWWNASVNKVNSIISYSQWKYIGPGVSKLDFLLVCNTSYMTTDKSLNHVDLKLHICKIKKLDQMTSKNTFHLQNSMTSFPPHKFLSTQRIHGTFQKSVQWFKGTIYTFPRNSNLKLYLLDNPCHLTRKKMLNIIQVTLPKLKTRNKKTIPIWLDFPEAQPK